jgi:hypothetical protein
MMTMAEFQHMLDAYGAYPPRWPADKRNAATRLLAEESQARQALARASRLDATIGSTLDVGSADGSRVLAALAAQPLPPQRHRWWALPTALLNVDFTPAWPRVAALAGVAVLGFAIGLVSLDVRDGAASTDATLRADAGLSVVAFEPEALTGVRP